MQVVCPRHHPPASSLVSQRSPLQAEGREPSGLTTEVLTELARLGLVDIETLEGTDRHPVWSEDRQDMVPLDELEPSETLRAADYHSSTLQNHNKRSIAQIPRAYEHSDAAAIRW